MEGWFLALRELQRPPWLWVLSLELGQSRKLERESCPSVYYKVGFFVCLFVCHYPVYPKFRARVQDTDRGGGSWNPGPVIGTTLIGLGWGVGEKWGSLQGRQGIAVDIPLSKSGRWWPPQGCQGVPGDSLPLSVSTDHRLGMIWRGGVRVWACSYPVSWLVAWEAGSGGFLSSSLGWFGPGWSLLLIAAAKRTYLAFLSWSFSLLDSSFLLLNTLLLLEGLFGGSQGLSLTGVVFCEYRRLTGLWTGYVGIEVQQGLKYLD